MPPPTIDEHVKPKAMANSRAIVIVLYAIYVDIEMLV